MENNSNDPYLTKNIFYELAQKFNDHQMDMKSGVTPIYASFYHDSGELGTITNLSPVRSMEKIIQGSYVDQNAKTITLPGSVK